MACKVLVKAGQLYEVRTSKGHGKVRVKNVVVDAIGKIADCVVVEGLFSTRSELCRTRRLGDITCLRIGEGVWKKVTT